MNMSTLCTIKYMNRSYFSNRGRFLNTGTPLPKLPPPPSYPRGPLKLWLYIVKWGVSGVHYLPYLTPKIGDSTFLSHQYLEQKNEKYH